MLEVSFLRENQSLAIERLSKRGMDASQSIAAILQADDERKASQQKLEELLSESNALAKETGALYKAGKQQEAEELKKRSVALKAQSHDLKEALKTAESKVRSLLCTVPNVPHEQVPKGNSAEENEIVYASPIEPLKLEQALPHWELAEKFQLIDFDLGSKISGSGFVVFKGKGARLERALINFFLEEAIKAGYQEFIPPLLVNETSGFSTGQLPDKEAQMYHLELDNLFLIPTAEVPLTNLYRDAIVEANQLPVKMAGYTPCFRREAGSYGKDVRGLNRLHQFDKVEIVQIQHPDESYQTLDAMVKHVEGLLKKLKLPYRIAKLCGGDLGFTSALTYDLEVFSAAQEKWLEVSSVSNFETYQSNRLKLRYKEGNEKPKLAHTLNGSALALPRILAAILENNQSEAGIRVPEVLVPFAGFEVIA